MKKCHIFVYRAFYQKSLCNKTPIWGIFLLKMGHFFVPRGWQPWKGVLSSKSADKKILGTWVGGNATSLTAKCSFKNLSFRKLDTLYCNTGQ